MKTLRPSQPDIDLSSDLYYQLVYTLTDLLPPPLEARVEKNVSDDGTDSQDAAFETWLSAQLWNQGAGGSGETDLPEVVRAAMAKSRLAGGELPANGRDSPARVAQGAHIERESASTRSCYCSASPKRGTRAIGGIRGSGHDSDCGQILTRRDRP